MRLDRQGWWGGGATDIKLWIRSLPWKPLRERGRERKRERERK